MHKPRFLNLQHLLLGRAFNIVVYWGDNFTLGNILSSPLRHKKTASRPNLVLRVSNVCINAGLSGSENRSIWRWVSDTAAVIWVISFVKLATVATWKVKACFNSSSVVIRWPTLWVLNICWLSARHSSQTLHGSPFNSRMVCSTSTLNARPACSGLKLARLSAEWVSFLFPKLPRPIAWPSNANAALQNR